ncbi:MAG: hypothetical protein FJX22_03365 [Alphaproteobacteria bacterium]|nr:hypothetical protein [Alphaproteobacteria bacterium]
MATPLHPAARFVAGFTAAATVGLSGMSVTASPNPPATLASDARSNGSYGCRVVIVDDWEPLNLRLKTNEHTKNIPYIKISHGELVSLRTGTPNVTYDQSLVGSELRALNDVTEYPSIINLSFVPYIGIDGNGRVTNKKYSALPLNVVSELIHNFLDPTYPKSKLANVQDLEKYKKGLLKIIYDSHKPEKSDNPDLREQKESFIKYMNYVQSLVETGSLVVHGAGNGGKDSVTPFSLINGVVTVAGYDVINSSVGPSKSTLYASGAIDVGKILPSTESETRYSVLLNNTLNVPVHFSDKLPNELQIKFLLPGNSYPLKAGTSYAAPQIAGAASKYCNTLSELDPAKRLQMTRDWLLQQGTISDPTPSAISPSNSLPPPILKLFSENGR